MSLPGKSGGETVTSGGGVWRNRCPGRIRSILLAEEMGEIRTEIPWSIGRRHSIQLYAPLQEEQLVDGYNSWVEEDGGLLEVSHVRCSGKWRSVFVFGTGTL